VATNICKRVPRDEGLSLIESGLYTHVCHGKQQPHSLETKLVISQIAKNQPRRYCSTCDRYIQGASNWDRHISSATHMEKL